MSARRRSRGRGKSAGDANRSQPSGRTRGSAPGTAAKGGTTGRGDGSRSSKSGSRKRGRRPPQKRRDQAGFWGEEDKLPTAQSDIRITDDPAAMPRSLGPPPLPGHETIAESYFMAVYDRAVTTAGALAAAGGLIDLEALADEYADE